MTLRCKRHSREVAVTALISKMEQAYVFDPMRDMTDERRAASFQMWHGMYRDFAGFLHTMLDERDYKLVMDDVERAATNRGWPTWQRGGLSSGHDERKNDQGAGRG